MSTEQNHAAHLDRLAARRIDRVNLGTMRHASIVAEYAVSQGLTAPERASLDAVRELVVGQPILDIGVGGGRTVKALLDISTDYLGIDYSPEMVAACLRRYPGVRFEHADARDLANVANASISLAVFSCNGIDMVAHTDRLRIMREVHRVLRPGGVFLFSTHNRHHLAQHENFQWPDFRPTWNPMRLLLRTGGFASRTLVRAINRARFGRLNVRTPDYCLVNTWFHDYGTMIYYTDVAAQLRQLETLGFQPGTVAYDFEGRVITTDPPHHSIVFAARR